jgi:PEP-CTERM motif
MYKPGVLELLEGATVIKSAPLVMMGNQYTASFSTLLGPGDDYTAEITGTANVKKLGISGTVTTTDAAPEPSTWAMMLIGFIGLGYVAFRQREGSSRRTRDLISERSYELKGRREAAFSFAGSDCGKLRPRSVLKLEHSGRIGQPMQPVGRGLGEAQQKRPAAGRGHALELGLAHDFGAEGVGDDEARLGGHQAGGRRSEMAK